MFTISRSKDILFTTLENELEKVTDWFGLNNMIVNPEKFQSMILKKLKEQGYKHFQISEK